MEQIALASTFMKKSSSGNYVEKELYIVHFIRQVIFVILSFDCGGFSRPASFVRKARTTFMRVQTLELPSANPLKAAQAALGTALLTAYGFSAKKDLLAQLLGLNQEVAAKIERGEPVTAPGVAKH